MPILPYLCSQKLYSMRKYTKWIVGILLSPFILILLLGIALYLPPVQNWAVHTVADYASEKYGMNISVDRVCLVFPLDLGIDGVKVIQQNDSLPQVKDTVADIKRIVVDVQLMPLLHSDVQIDRFDVYDMKVNTADFVHEARVKGVIGLLSIASHGIDLKKETVRLDNALITDADIDVALSDTVPEDTSKSEARWKIALDKLRIENSKATIHTPRDSVKVTAQMGELEVCKGNFDLYAGVYDVVTAVWRKGGVKYDNNFQPRSQGLDVNHIELNGVALGIDSLHFASQELRLAVSECQMKEKSGIAIDSLRAKVNMNAATLYVDGRLVTPSSNADVDVAMDLNAFDDKTPGIIDAKVKALLGKQDLLLAMGTMPKDFRDRWPEKPLDVDVSVKGNMKHLDIKSMYADLPAAFHVTASGYADNVADMDMLKAKVHVDATTRDLSFIKSLIDNKQINIPAMNAVADLEANGRNYDIDFNVREGNGSIAGKGSINTQTMTYAANIDADDIQLQHFVGGMGLGGFSGKATVKGRGTDIFSRNTNITAEASVGHFNLDKWNLNNMRINAAMSGGMAHAVLESHNDLLEGVVGFDGLMSRNPIQATLTAEVDKADLFSMKLASAPLTVGVCAHVDVATDMREYYKLQGLISDLTIRDSNTVYRPDDMVLDFFTRRDTTHAVADCGDFHLNADMKGGYKYLMNVKDRIMAEVSRQASKRVIDQNPLRELLPTGHIYLSSGTENPVARMAGRYDYQFSGVFMDVTSSPSEGLNGSLKVDTLKTLGFQIDNIDLQLQSDDKEINYFAHINNGPDNPQYTFHAEAEGHLQLNGTTLNIAIDDKNGQRGVALGLAAKMEENGLRVNFVDDRPILGYKAFSVNDDNYVFLSRDMRVSADVMLKSDDGVGIQIYTDDDNTDALQDITVSLHRFDIERLLSVVPYTPQMSGILDGDFHAIVTPEDMSVSSSVEFQKLVYEGCPIGNISSEFVYVPLGDGSHHIDGLLFKDAKEIGSLMGTYNPAGEGSIDVAFTMDHFPLDMVNGFMPDQIIGLQGYGEGVITAKGSLASPDVNGEVFLQDASLISVPYGVSMRFDDDPVRIVGSQLLLENFQMYANNDQPLIVQGKLDFSDMSHINVDMRMRAQNFLVVDAKESRLSEAYGKAFINLFARMNGELDKLSVRGRVEVLPTTNLYYILRDSPITTDNRLKELVTFTDLQAEKPITIVRPTVEGMTVDLTLNVVEGAHITCWLNANHSNYLDVVGGGDLRMRYASEELTLNGRYTISNGEMKYSLPIIPLKTFKITEGSYIEFTGDVMNPKLSITAKEQNKTNVNVEGTDQMVLFECGVVLSKTLKDMGLEFVIESPENQTVSDDLKSMTLEERGKLAVTMLTTGMYLSESNTSSFSMNSALNSFLQQEINNIAGSALRTLDLSLGMENNTDAEGRMHTDYSFKFAKRFWNNRLSISVGGKISTGPDVSGQNNTFFDNVEVQYRTSATSNQYLRLFYKRAVYDYLEGYVGEYGAGYMWKRKLQNFRDIFQFGDANLSAPSMMMQRDTLRKNSSMVIGDTLRNVQKEK